METRDIVKLNDGRLGVILEMNHDGAEVITIESGITCFSIHKEIVSYDRLELATASERKKLISDLYDLEYLACNITDRYE